MGSRGRRRKRRRRRGASEWRALIERQRGSRQSVRAFCVEHDLGEANFYAWRRYLRDEGAASAEDGAEPSERATAQAPQSSTEGSAGFVRLEPEAEASSNAVEVRFACGATLHCASAHLPELVRLLKHEGQEAERC